MLYKLLIALFVVLAMTTPTLAQTPVNIVNFDCKLIVLENHIIDNALRVHLLNSDNNDTTIVQVRLWGDYYWNFDGDWSKNVSYGHWTITNITSPHDASYNVAVASDSILCGKRLMTRKIFLPIVK